MADASFAHRGLSDKFPTSFFTFPELQDICLPTSCSSTACHSGGGGDAAGLRAHPLLPPPKGVPGAALPRAPGGPGGCRAQSPAILNKTPSPTSLLVSQGLLRQKDLGRKVTVVLELSGPVQWRFVTGFEAGAAR